MEKVAPLEFLPELAGFVASWFPELGGRAIAVTEAEVTKENRPDLPLAILALNREEATHDPKSNQPISLSDDFIIEFWLELKKLRSSKTKEEVPFWAYYNYEAIRDRLLTRIIAESMSRENWGIRYVSMDVAADAGAVILTFRFSRNYRWCMPEDEGDEPVPLLIISNVCPATERPSCEYE